MTLFDYAVIAIIGISLAIGVWRGVVGELIAIAAWIIAFFIAHAMAPLAAGTILVGITDPDVRIFLAWLLVFILVLICMGLVRMAISKTLHSLGLGVSDRILGFIFGFARGLLLVLILVGAGGMTTLPRQPWWAQAQLSPPLETLVLALKDQLPAEVANRIQFR